MLKLEITIDFPPVSQAWNEPNGLLAAGGEITPGNLIHAYSQGIFPWSGPDEPVLWWSPDPRMVLFTNEFHLPRSLGKLERRSPFEIRFDTAFREVMRGCTIPRPGQEGTWITPEVIDGYCTLHQLGFAHSAEAWRDGALVGGLYYVQIGKMVYGESMFYQVPDASKIAFSTMVQRVRNEGVEMIDCQQNTDHLARFGAREISRAEFLRRMTSGLNAD